MTIDQLKYLCTSEAKEAVKANLANDPIKVAMNKHLKESSLIASQVKYLQRARLKLPSYYDAVCVIPNLGFEQSSSEVAASVKEIKGGVCLDLCCGLGVDTKSFSMNFDKVIALERDPVMAEVARENFKRMAIDNVEIICSSAEDFLTGFTSKIDLVYADPDRRGAEGKKQVLLQDCSPNMIDLEEKLWQITDRIMIKCSPLFDVDEPFRLFDRAESVEVISYKGECKEVVINLSKTPEQKTIKVVALGRQTLTFGLGEDELFHGEFAVEAYNYLTVPDVALQKARCVTKFYCGEGVFVENNNAVVLSAQPLEDNYGVSYKILGVEKYSPKKLKKDLKARGVKKIELLKRNFPISSEQIIKDLALKQGSQLRFMFTEIRGVRYVFELGI